MKGICRICGSRSPAEYLISTELAELACVCPSHGLQRSSVSGDPIDFQHRLTLLAKAVPVVPRALIVELLDGCNMRCPTCIAGSSPDLTALRLRSFVIDAFDAAAADPSIKAVMLSGGEPTIHPEFLGLCKAANEVSLKKVLITNGTLFADPTRRVQAECFGNLAAGNSWEVLLQFDSVRPESLIDIRGADLRDIRSQSIEFLAEFGIPVTLVCVAKRGITLHQVAEVTSLALAMPGVVGVQFQPIRSAGRVDNYLHSENSCNSSDVIDELVRNRLFTRLGMAVDPASPLSLTVGILDKVTGQELSVDFDESQVSFLMEPPRGAMRVTVVEYSDVGSWTSMKASRSPVVVVRPDGDFLAVDDHFILGDEQRIEVGRAI